MSKYNKIVFLIIIVLLLVVMIIPSIKKKNERFKAIDEMIAQIVENEETTMLYINSSECKECNFQVSQMSLLISEYNLGYYYIDMDGVSNSKKKDIYKKLGIKDITIPSIQIYKEGKLEDELKGINSVKTIFDFIKENAIINKESELVINYINFDEYKKIIRSSEKTLILIGSFTDEYSNQAQTILWKLSKEKEITINYFILTDLTEKEGAEFEKTLDYYEENEVKIPDLLLVSNSKVLHSMTGLGSKNEYIDFLIDNLIIEDMEA